MDRTFLCDLCAFARALFLAGYFFSTSRQDHKDLLTRGTFASSAPLREDKLQIINDPTYVTILQPSAVKIYE